nr:single-stranded DNA-binding protein [Olegusella massiliensis]
MSINRVIITGNLTRDPELRSTNGGTQVLTFGVAVNDRRRNAQGEWEDKANFVDCVMFGNRAQSLSNYLYKGMKVAIEGRLSYSSWESNGQRRSKLEVIVDELEFLSSRQNTQQQGGYQQQQPQAQPQPAPRYSAPQPTYNQGSYAAPAATPQTTPAQTPPPSDVYDEDIPF